MQHAQNLEVSQTFEQEVIESNTLIVRLTGQRVNEPRDTTLRIFLICNEHVSEKQSLRMGSRIAGGLSCLQGTADDSPVAGLL